MADKKVTLSRTLKTHKGDLKELILREPTARDYITLRRTPFSLVWHQEVIATRPDGVGERTGEMVTNYELVFLWAERLTGIETMILETLKNVDVVALTEAMREVLMTSDTDPEDKAKVDDTVKNLSASSQT